MITEHPLVHYFKSIAPLSTKEAQTIMDSMEIRHYPKGTILLQEGQIAKECYFVIKGCVRSFMRSDGEEKIHNFFIEDDWIIALDGFLYQKPSLHYLVCCEDVELAVGMAGEAPEQEHEPRFEDIARKVMEHAYTQLQKEMKAYYNATPEMRYQKLLSERPSLLQRIPQYQIASYIGVQPETLSRMRARMARGRS